MKKTFFALLLLGLVLAVAGCGDGHSGPTQFSTDILSDPVYDGDIVQDAGTGILTVTQGNAQRIFAGVDPLTLDQYRAFLDFPLGGPGGVPINAFIDSAVLSFFVSDLSPLPLAGSIPIRVDLVDTSSLTLTSSDFNLPALAATTVVPAINQADLNREVTVDVTALMAEAQRRGFSDLQLRLEKDLGGTTGRIEINDTTALNRRSVAPLLRVTYSF